MRKSFLDRLAKDMARDLNRYFELISKLLSLLPGGSAKVPVIKFLAIDGSTVDERLKKLETARQNLVDSLHAIEELRAEAELNRAQLAELLAKLEHTKVQKNEVERDLASLRQLAETDVDSFRRVVGVPNERDRFRERLVGFVTGVLASILAAVLWELGKLAIVTGRGDR